MPRYWKTESWQCGRCAAQKRRASTAERVNRGNTLPTFTFNGLRYAEIVGAGPIAAADIEAAVIGSDLRRTGWLHTSDPLVNRLHKNVFWGMRGNFLDVPTDCPQRDERLGWTGDIQVFAPTANYLFNSAGFLSNWLYDLSLEQKPDGGVPFIVPDVLRNPDPAAAAWGDAATFVPSALYAGYDDRQMLARQYPSMRAWVETVRSLVSPSGLWDTGFQFRDWRDPTAPEEDSARAQADPHVVATAYFARSTHLLADAASVLGRPDDAATYEAVASQAVVAFNRAYVAVDGTVLSDCQTVYALALNWGLITDVTARRKAGERLAALVRDADYRVSTGFVGTPLILDALCLAGQPSLAFGMLLQRECRSWLYAVTMGATTVWERWDSMLPDGSVNPGTMTSFNHYACGSVADWMHRSIGGIAPTSAGYRTVEVRPLVTGDLTHAVARHDSPYGAISTDWTLAGDDFSITVIVPYGVTATVWLPGAKSGTLIGRGRHDFATRIPRGAQEPDPVRLAVE